MEKNDHMSVPSEAEGRATVRADPMHNETEGVAAGLPPVTLRLAQSEGGACLALEDTMAPPALVLEIINNSPRPINLQGVTPWTVTMEFRHGVLSQSSLDMLRGNQLVHNMIGSAWSNQNFQVELSVPDDPGVAIKLGIRRLYLDLDPIAPGQSFKLPLYGLSAAPEAGPRLTRVRLTHDNLHLEGDDQKIAGDTIQLLQIMSRVYARPDPLQAYFVSGTALDPDINLNAAVLAVAFRDGRPFKTLRAAGPHLRLTVQVGDAPSALCSADDIRTIRVYEKFNDPSRTLKSSKAFKLDQNCPTLAHADITLDTSGQDFGTVFYIGIAEIPVKSRPVETPGLGGHLGPGESHWDYPVPITLEYANIGGAPGGVIDLSLTRFPGGRSDFALIDERLRALENAQRDDPGRTAPVQPKETVKPKERDPVRHYFKWLDTPAWVAGEKENAIDIPPLFSTFDGVPGPYFEVSHPHKTVFPEGYNADLTIDGVLVVHKPTHSRRKYYAPPSIDFGVDLSHANAVNVLAQVIAITHDLSPEILENPTLETLKAARVNSHYMPLQVDTRNARLVFDPATFNQFFWRAAGFENSPGLLIFFESLKFDLIDIENPKKLFPDAD